ncbi:MAG: tetratricopeptide repeat protein [Gammaproteobacteria bacterium]
MTAEQPSSNHLVFSQTLIQHGKHKKAQSLLNALLKENPVNSKALELLGISYLKCNEYHQAEESLKKVISLQGDNPKHYYNLGFAQKGLNKNEEAITSYQKAITLDPKYQYAYINLGNIFSIQNQAEQAIQAYSTALKINPNNPLVHYNLAFQYEQIGRVKDAIDTYLKVLQLEPGTIAAIYRLAQLYIQLGDVLHATSMIERGLNLQPGFGPLYRILTLCQTYTDPNHPHIQTIHTLLNNPKLKEDDRAQLYYGLGKIFDNLKNYDAAFDAYQKANEIQGKLHPFDFNHFLEFTNSIMNSKPVSYALKASPLTPIFIVGMPMAGKSLLESIMANHSKIHTCGNLSIEPYLKQPENFQKLLSTVCPKDKLPILTKFTHIYHLNLLMLLFPKAKIIYLKRSHMDTCLNQYFQYSESKAQIRDLKILALFHREFDLLMLYWKKQYKEHIISIQFEDLIRKPDDTLKSVYHFLDIKPEPLKHINLHESEIGRWKNYQAKLFDLQIIFRLTLDQLKSLLHKT